MVYEYDRFGVAHCKRCEGLPAIENINSHNGIHNAMVRIKHTLEYANESERALLLALFA